MSSEESSKNDQPTRGKRKKAFNLNTYKNHSLGDYLETIKRFGTVDSYSTESVGIFYSV